MIPDHTFRIFLLLASSLFVAGGLTPTPLASASASGASCCDMAQEDSEDVSELTPEERRYQDVCAQLNCLCAGCRAQLSNCPHVQCGFAIPARQQVRALIAEGLTDQEILDRMVEEHGTQILCKPPAEGTNLGAYLIPVLFVVGGGIGAVFMLRAWKRRPPPDEGTGTSPTTGRSSDVDDRIEAHLANLD